MLPTADARGVVVIVEPDEAIRTLLMLLLRRAGFATREVPDLGGALRLMRRRTVDAIVCDMMPVDAANLAALRLPHSTLRRIVVTTTAPESEIRESAPMELFAILRKPFDSAQITDLVRACAQQARRQDPDERKSSRARLVRSLRKFLRDAPHLQRLLTAPVSGDRELMLRGEMRTAIHELSRVFAEAAEQQSVPGRASEFREAATVAADLAVRNGNAPANAAPGH